MWGKFILSLSSLDPFLRIFLYANAIYLTIYWTDVRFPISTENSYFPGKLARTWLSSTLKLEIDDFWPKNVPNFYLNDLQPPQMVDISEYLDRAQQNIVINTSLRPYFLQKMRFLEDFWPYLNKFEAEMSPKGQFLQFWGEIFLEKVNYLYIYYL